MKINRLSRGAGWAKTLTIQRIEIQKKKIFWNTKGS